MRDSSSNGSRTKYRKPRSDFPLFPHASGRWCKKIRGKHHYFGKIADDPDGQKALELWLEQRDDLLAGRTPRPKRNGLTVADLVNQFLTAKCQAVESGELTKGVFDNYFRTLAIVVDTFGRNRPVVDLDAQDFARLRHVFADRYGPETLGLLIAQVRCVFRWAYETGLTDQPIRYGPGFKKPSAAVIRRHKAASGPKLFESSEVRKLLAEATEPLRAMILLGVNCGFGPGDCARLTVEAVDLDSALIDFPRPKTGIPRRCPLWPETVEALWLRVIDKPAGTLVFADVNFGYQQTGIAKRFRAVAEKCKLYRRGRGIYAMRHSFRTVADETGDIPAVRLIMGHLDPTIDAVYRQRIADDRLRRVVDYVRAWLFNGHDDGEAD